MSEENKNNELKKELNKVVGGNKSDAVLPNSSPKNPNPCKFYNECEFERKGECAFYQAGNDCPKPL